MAQAMIMRRGGGGSRVGALAVTAVANYASLPASPTLYQMCIVSATAVNDVYVTNTAPASPATGDVQIVVGASASQPVPADPDGMIMLYPVNAYQYTGSVWVLRDMYTWSGTAWVAPARYLVQAGVDNTAFGGALILTSGSITYYTGYFYVGVAEAELRKPTAIDVTPYRAMKIHARNAFGQGTLKGYTRLSLAGANVQEVVVGTSEGIYTIDLTAATGLKYLGLSIPSSAGMYMWNWWLE